MKKLLFLFAALFVMGLTVACAQNANQPIRVERVLGGYDLLQQFENHFIEPDEADCKKR